MENLVDGGRSTKEREASAHLSWLLLRGENTHRRALLLHGEKGAETPPDYSIVLKMVQKSLNQLSPWTLKLSRWPNAVLEPSL